MSVEAMPAAAGGNRRLSNQALGAGGGPRRSPYGGPSGGPPAPPPPPDGRPYGGGNTGDVRSLSYLGGNSSRNFGSMAPGSAGESQDFSVVRGGIHGYSKEERGATGFQGQNQRPFVMIDGEKWIRDGDTWRRESSFNDPNAQAQGKDFVDYNTGVRQARGGSNMEFTRADLQRKHGVAGGNAEFQARIDETRQHPDKDALNESIIYQGTKALPGTPGVWVNGGRFFDADMNELPPRPEWVRANGNGGWQQPGGGPQTGAPGAPNYTGLPTLAGGGVVAPAPGGRQVMVNGRPVVAGDGGQPEAVLPISTLASVVSQAAAHGAQVGSGAGAPPGVPRLYMGGVIPGEDGNRRMENDDPSNTGNTGGGRRGFGIPQTPGPPIDIAPRTDPTGDRFGGTSFTPRGRYAPATYDPYKERGMGADEQQQLAAITSLARLLQGQGQGAFNIGSQAYSDAIRYYQTLLGGNRAAMASAVAPTAEAIREQGQGTEQRTRAALGRSGAADAAIAAQAQNEASQIAQVTRGVQPGAAAALASGGATGMQIGGGLEQAAGGFYDRALSSLTQHRQFEEGLGESSKQFGAGLTEGSRQFGANIEEQSRQFSAQLAEQVRQGNMSAEQASAALALQQTMFNSEYALKLQQYQEAIRQFDEQMRLQRDQMRYQRNRSTGSGIGALIGTGVGAAFGGPAGATLGSTIGGTAGSLFK